MRGWRIQFVVEIGRGRCIMRTDRRSNLLRWVPVCLLLFAVAVAGPLPPFTQQGQARGVKGQIEESESSSQAAFELQTSGLLAPMIITGASGALRGRIAEAMEQAASSFGLVLDTTDLVYICRGDLVVVNCGVSAGSSAVPSAEASLDVGLIYTSREVEIRFGDGVRGRRLPGFYAVRLSTAVAGTGSEPEHDPGITLLEIIGDSGAPALTVPVAMLPPTSDRRLTACLDVGSDGAEDTLCLGWFGSGFGIRLCFALLPAGNLEQAM